MTTVHTAGPYTVEEVTSLAVVVHVVRDSRREAPTMSANIVRTTRRRLPADDVPARRRIIEAARAAAIEWADARKERTTTA